jgi:putative DNA primase/helicase
MAKMIIEALVKTLGGRKTGNGWMARCPAHDDREPSLSIRDAGDGRVLFRCHAGCDQGRVISALRSRGLWEDRGNRHMGPAPRRDERPDSNDTKRTEAALVLWQAAKPASGTLLETYLTSRGLCLPPPPTLRFHAGLKHPSGGIWPAMVALVTRGFDDTPLAIHRTFLARDGAGKATVNPQKMMLGPCRGGAVKLCPIAHRLLIAEGIETALSAMRATGQGAWAALSTSGLRALELPMEVREVVLLADGDDPGEAAARDAALRWKCEGRLVRIARPPRGFDFNDVLLDRTFRNIGDAA